MRFFSLKWRVVCVWVLLILTISCATRTRPMYMNQFAVQLAEGGHEDANVIADKHGFRNLGQVIQVFLS